MHKVKKLKKKVKQSGFVVTITRGKKVTYQAVGWGGKSVGLFESYRRAQLAALINRHFHALGYENIPRTMEAI